MTNLAATAPPTTRQVRAALGLQFGQALDGVADNTLFHDALGDRYDSLAVLECAVRSESGFGIEVDFVEHESATAFRRSR